MKVTTLLSVIAFALILVVASGCKKKPLPTSLELTSITAGNVDLKSPNPVDVDPSASIVATFAFYLDNSSVTNSNIILMPASDTIQVNIQVSASRNMITITPISRLNDHTEYALHLGNKLKSTFGLYYDGATFFFTTK